MDRLVARNWFVSFSQPLRMKGEVLFVAVAVKNEDFRRYKIQRISKTVESRF